MSLTHIEILEIINTCKGHVKSLKIKGGSIEVEFIVPHQPVSAPPSTHNQGIEVETALEIPDEENVITNSEEPVADKDLSRLEEIDDLNISNPSLMEDMIANDEVVRGYNG